MKIISDLEKFPLLTKPQKNYSTNSKARSGSEKSVRYHSGRVAVHPDLKRIPILKLFAYSTKSDKWVLAVGTVSAMVHGCGMPALALVFGSMTDTFNRLDKHGLANESSVGNRTDQNTDAMTGQEFADYVTQYSLYYIYISIMILVSSLVQARCWEWTCERQILRIRQAFLYQVLRQEMSWFEQTQQSGSLTVKLTDDLERIREGIGYKFSIVIELLTTFFAGFAIGIYTNWQLTLIIMSTTPFIAIASAITGKLVFTQTARERHKYGMAGAVAEEVLSSIKTVQSLGGEQREINRYDNSLKEGLEIAIKKYHYLALGIGSIFFLMFANYGFAFWFGCRLLGANLVTPGDMFTVLVAVLYGSFALGGCAPSVTAVGMALASAGSVFETIDSMPEIDTYSKAGLKLSRVVGKIEFQNLSFSYPSRNEVSVVHNFSLEINAGKTIAIVGASGSGKSTLVNLILRFYDPNAGMILLDGRDIRDLNLAWYRNQIGVVAQEPILFDTTIYDNIRYGRDDVSPEEIVAAARVAGAHEFISMLPAGYETITGERGAQLSGGQKQRIAIARALARNPRLLILDEATSALDAKSEGLVHEALDEARHGRTTVIIAHRLSTIKNADVIYALKDGSIFESGTHTELMAKEGLYYNLTMAQTTISSEENTVYSFDSNEDATREFFDDDRRFKRKIRHERKKFRNALPVPDLDKARLVKEAAELNVALPSKFRILRESRPEWLLLTGGTIGSVFAAFVMSVFGFSYAEMFDSLSLEGRNLENAALFWSIVFMIMAVLSGLGSWLRTVLIGVAGEILTKRLRLQSYKAVVRQPLAWFDQEVNSPVRISTRLARDAPLIKGMAGNWLSAAVASFVIVFFGLGLSFWAGWQLSLVMLVGFPILVLSGYHQLLLQKPGQRKYLKMIEDAGRVATEAIQNIKTVQSLSIEHVIYEQYLQHLKLINVEVHRQGLKFSLILAFTEAVTYCLYAVAFYYGGYLVGQGVMNPTDVYRVFFGITFSAMSVGQAASLVPEQTKAKLAAGLIFNLIETKSTIDPFNPEGLRPVLKGRVTFSNVIFNYPSRLEVPVLQGLSFDLQPGTTLAFVGASGVGKSTVVSLLERFYDVTDGRILVDGFDIRSIQVAHLRSIIGLVTQEPVLFDCSIRDNIAYGFGNGTIEVPEESIIEAAVAANIHEFIINLPMGYETLVGDRGTQISGGQKQRIAIARALVRNPRILLLDEATSALDTESELIVQEALDKARLGRTCIIIAHRLSTIQTADCIAVMSHGRLVEIGTHDQLIKARRIYYKLTKKQQITN